ncbi:uncharacterized protein SPPG_02361 [Spizellomyces punctatus DAOM BR117]|uniref:peptidylprolyl isomerase n=1 Tax=Spizellomyces punctatus (strain DAOM BR117) TaxID=645134 RepID=A0A0L0HR31_SPIPD|nr:uncharacterized protein SPPG_02361 [Spizellomyces punctatus DAOM BR117]KND03314.1 hypothetical protein SPPG_02361 [Spizellomyces punctatus DAOM BR117]|eukprot:XP_016611353.1 hypothetical protein SPPG_02361 [Spizellomyces punctatus DAOM BR117]
MLTLRMPNLLVLLTLVLVLLSAPFQAAAEKPKRPPPTQLQIGIKKRVPKEDCKETAAAGDVLSMHYTGTLYDTGEKFDSSLDRNQPFDFTLGQGHVIKGWDQGLVGMCVGEKRRLVIPAHLGYGDRGAGDKIPAGATLVFETELLNIKKTVWGNRPSSEL